MTETSSGRRRPIRYATPVGAPEPGPELVEDYDPERPRFSPYATIALISALLGLFWIAIPYAVMSFRQEGGRGENVIALMIGSIELLIAFTMLIASLKAAGII